MADWAPPDRYEGKLVLPSAPAPVSPAAAAAESSRVDSIAVVFEELYAREPRLTRDLLRQLRAASVEDLKRLFG
jgi:hypothetical protein